MNTGVSIDVTVLLLAVGGEDGSGGERGRERERGIAGYDIAQSISEKIGSDLWRDDRARRVALLFGSS